jgi:hypothetical protein
MNLSEYKFLQLIEAQSASNILIKDNKNEQIIKFASAQYAKYFAFSIVLIICNFLSLKTWHCV